MAYNVPFGSYKVADPRYDKYNLHIHDYFIAKSLDVVKPGGIVAVITTKGTLEAVRDVIDVQLGNGSEEAFQEALSTLNDLYDAYVHEFGTMATRANRLAFQQDDDYPLLCSLPAGKENVPAGKKILGVRKAGVRPLCISFPAGILSG